MLTVGPKTRVFICTDPVDMRKSWGGLCGIVTSRLGSDPLSGDLFVFANRRRTLMKILYWDRDGLAIWQKRLERGTFEMPAVSDRGRVEMTSVELAMLIGGVQLADRKHRLRYSIDEASRRSADVS